MNRYRWKATIVAAISAALILSPVVASVPLALAASSPTLTGLPQGVPPAALWPDTPLPTPAGWPFPDAFPHTSGTGRLDDGAFFWSDFLFDANGAKGGERVGDSSLAPPAGSYTYPAGDDGDDADIFAAAVGLDGANSYWRVDFASLPKATVPIAEWALDTDDNAATGGDEWPAGAGVKSPGSELYLLVSARGAWLINATTGIRTAVSALGGSLSVTTNPDFPGSFVVRIPRSAMAVSGKWRIRLAAGLANAAGNGFAPVSGADGALPGQPAVYNVTFRSYQQETEQYGPLGTPALPDVPTGVTSSINGLARGNFWMDANQAYALTQNNVAPFSQVVDWNQLAAKVTTPELDPTGYSDRWYVSAIDSGAGIVDSNGPVGTPVYRGRIQPYAVYVPTSYRPSVPTSLTWITHSLDVNLNQYGALDPQLLIEACEDRDSICATPEGFGPGGWMTNDAETDFWQVWHSLAETYTLDPNTTVLSGYSMGGYSTYKLGLEYPDLFAEAMPLAGPPVCGISITTGVSLATGSGQCGSDGNTGPLVDNATWLPFIMADGAADELVPITGVLTQISLFNKDNERYRFFFYPAEDHLVFATQDGFAQEAAALGHPVVVHNPPTIHYSWYPNLTVPALGIGTTGDYWLSDLGARNSSPGRLATVIAESKAIADPHITVTRSVSPDPVGQPTPNVVFSLGWTFGVAPPTSPVVDLTLSNVAALTVDLARAGLGSGPGTISVDADGPIFLGLSGLAPTAGIALDGRHVHTIMSNGVPVLPVPTGQQTITWS
jgi:hypothetical protein